MGFCEGMNAVDMAVAAGFSLRCLEMQRGSRKL